MVTRWGKFWIAATAVSLFLYVLRWLYGNVVTVYEIVESPAPFAYVAPWRFWVDRVLTGLIGNGLRLTGSALSLMILFMLWKTKPISLDSIKGKVSVALVCEGVYWLLVFPISIIELFFLERAQFVELAFMVQILLAGPLLIILAIKMWNYSEANKLEVLKWASIAAIGYLVGIWCNNVFRWFSMAQVTSISFILTGETGVGFLSALTTLSISLSFAVASFYTLFKKCIVNRATRLAGASLVFLGLNFVIYLIYSALTNSLGFVFLVEFWPITVLGLGVGMLRGRI